MKDDLIRSLENALNDNRFVRLSLAHHVGAEKDLKKILVRKVLIKKQDHLGFTYRYKTRDIVKNHKIDDGIRLLQDMIGSDFLIANLFTTQADYLLDLSGKKPVFKELPPSETSAPDAGHDRAKERLIESERAAPYLHALGLSDANGKIFKNAQDKFRQINRYIELLAPDLQSLSREKPVSVADMGSGKGYLTFALYDYLSRSLKIDATVTGVEMRDDLVSFCNDTARKSGMQNLSFVKGTIDGYTGKPNVLIALHACDTATDDAIYQGLQAEADLIVVAPCCHKQIRREMESASQRTALDSLTRHGIFLERQAEMVTDSMRALLLEYAGYKTRVFEFISDAHTPKNILIVASKVRKPESDKEKSLRSFYDLKGFFGIGYHFLEKKMGLVD